MTGGLSRLRRLWVYVALPVIFCMVTPPVQGHAQPAAQPVPIILQVSVPNHPSVRYGVDAIQQVVRSEDGGSSWSVVLDPGDAQAPDPSTPGACLPGTYDRVILL